MVYNNCRLRVASLVVLFLVLSGVNGTVHGQSPGRLPLVIAHRGSSGVLPEHTVAAYRRAIDDGADYVECDVTLTQDLVPVCLHENWLKQTTDVANRGEFANRRRNRTVANGNNNSIEIDDWFAVDFTLTELKTLRTKQRFEFRDPSHNGKYEIATLEEHLWVVRNATRKVGTYPEIKDPEWLNSLDIMNGTKFEDIVLETLIRHGFKSRTDDCIIQSFSEESLYYLLNRTQLRLTMLLENDVPPPSKLAEWSRLGLYGVGPWINLITRVWTPEGSYKNWINSTTNLVEECHHFGLVIHAYTFRNEDRFLPWDFSQDINKAYEYYINSMDVDGFFTDFPETLVSYRRHLERKQLCEELEKRTETSGTRAKANFLELGLLIIMLVFSVTIRQTV